MATYNDSFKKNMIVTALFAPFLFASKLHFDFGQKSQELFALSWFWSDAHFTLCTDFD